MADKLMGQFPQLKINVYPIRNDFFGEMITVSGLLTGQDILAQLKDKPLGDKLLMPQNVLKSGEQIFLDDMTVDELEKALQVPIDIVKSSGWDFVDAVVF
jgi:NifB/MoaA-like Fe-S oxidoreductase